MGDAARMEETGTLWLRCGYEVVARVRGRPKGVFDVSETVPIRLLVVPTAAAPVVATAERTALPNGATLRIPRVEFREIEGRLMRPVHGPDGVPLSLEALRRIVAAPPDPRLARSWLDYPTPLLTYGRAMLCPQGLPDRDDGTLKDFGRTGRDAAVARLGAYASELRVVDGVLWRPTTGPCRCVERSHRSWKSYAVVPDLDFPALANRHGHEDDTPALVDFRVDQGALMDEMRGLYGVEDAPDGPFGPVANSVDGTIEVEGPDALPRRDMVADNAWSTLGHFSATMRSANWTSISPERKVAYAGFEAGLSDVAEGRGSIEEVGPRLAAAAAFMVGDPGFPDDYRYDGREHAWVPDSVSPIAVRWLVAARGAEMAALAWEAEETASLSP